MDADAALFEQTALDKAMRLQNGLVSQATSGSYDDAEYMELRRYFAGRPDTKAKLPDFVKRCGDMSQFWAFIKYEKPSYHERRALISAR